MQALKVLVIVMGVMIVVGIAVVTVTIVKRAGTGTAEPPDGQPGEFVAYGTVPVQLPPGASVTEELIHENHLVLRTRSGTGSVGYVVVDLLTGQVRGTLETVEAP